jgi:peptidoglycan/xylan/chitin deacetylase (PgdA/CDA1 family)
VGKRLLILGWHNVESTFCFPSATGAAVKGLTRQLELLARCTNMVSLPEALTVMESGEPLPPRATAITFDDGYQDSLDIAAPILVRMGVPATFFLVPEFLSGQVLAWWETLGWAIDRSPRPWVAWGDSQYSLTDSTRKASYSGLMARLKTLDDETRQRVVRALIDQLEPEGDTPVPSMFMNWDGARSLQDMGFTIGSHTLRHVILANETAETQQDDLRAARAQLNARLQGEIDIVAYPNGGRRDFNDASVDAARAAGYRAAVTTVEGCNDSGTSLYELRRFVVYPEWGLKAAALPLRQILRRLGVDRW